MLGKEYETMKQNLKIQVKENEQLHESLSQMSKQHENVVEKMASTNGETVDELHAKMQNVLKKKNVQINKLKRLMEKTINDYEKEKQEMCAIVKMREEQMYTLTKQLQS